MPITQKLNMFLLDIAIPQAEEMTDFLDQAQNFIAESLIEECTQFITSTEDFTALENLVESNATLDELAEFYKNHTPNYDQTVDTIFANLKKFIENAKPEQALELA
ncbi:MAG TPA: hypothetical protein PKD96_02730 [Candidatus Absconditabacterales bacterium]|nr:hypothetical protein [Candidatus Absconditabacterales bacterium]HMT27193.1 hypothetical protein [Candidatus Absconditabacterales bacterium]